MCRAKERALQGVALGTVQRASFSGSVVAESQGLGFTQTMPASFYGMVRWYWVRSGLCYILSDN
jgi:hypothetical protein